MAFHLLDLDTWPRRTHYEHFIYEAVCTYSTTVQLDITKLKGRQLYPAMIWLLTETVNRLPEFRTDCTAQGVGIYDQMHPAYTIFNPEHKTFSGIWTEFRPDYPAFLDAYRADVAAYAASTQYASKPGRPPNSFDVSMVPWVPFTAFHLQLHGDGKYLLPIFTLGQFSDTQGKRLLPLAIQVHHAVCDGYHVGQFLRLLQARIDQFPG